MTIGHDSFTKGEGLYMSRNSSLISLSFGENAFQQGSTWKMAPRGLPQFCPRVSERRSRQFGGSNFLQMEEVDFTAMPELTEIVCGKGCFHEGLTLICEGV